MKVLHTFINGLRKAMARNDASLLISSLKGCPCCGMPAYVNGFADLEGDNKEEGRVACYACGLSMADYTLRRAVEKWNRRISFHGRLDRWLTSPGVPSVHSVT